MRREGWVVGLLWWCVSTEGEPLRGFAEGEHSAAGRTVVPFDGYGGDLVFDDEVTTTVLGRSVEGGTKEEMAANVNKPLGTNYFRYQPEFMVGKNKGGGNVLDVADREWSWPLNNAWLQAAVDRGDRIRFVSDPASPRTLFKGGGNIKDGLTVTGMELGVLLHRGMAPELGSGVVRSRYVLVDEVVNGYWDQAAKEVKKSGKLRERDDDAYQKFLNAGKGCARTPKVFRDPDGNVVEVQSNFFGGQAGAMAA